MSMPVTSSATLRKGVDEGQAPTQMPQPAHQVGVDLRHLAADALVRVRNHGDGGVGQSSKQRRQPLQLPASTTATGTGALRRGRKGRTEQGDERGRQQPPHHASRAGVDQRVHEQQIQPVEGERPGTTATAGAWLITGCADGHREQRREAARSQQARRKTGGRLMR